MSVDLLSFSPEIIKGGEIRMGRFEENRIFVLNNPQAPRLCPELAAEIGLHESIILLQIDFWIAIHGHWQEGKKWTYQSVRDIQKMFPYISLATINRAIHGLIDKGLILEGNYNEYKYDKTRWFAINFDGCRKLKSVSIAPAWQEQHTGHDTHSNQNETPPYQPNDNPENSYIDSTPFQNGTRSNQFETGSTQNETGSNQFGTTIPESSSEITSENSSEISGRESQNFAEQNSERANARTLLNQPSPIENHQSSIREKDFPDVINKDNSQVVTVAAAGATAGPTRPRLATGGPQAKAHAENAAGGASDAARAHEALLAVGFEVEERGYKFQYIRGDGDERVIIRQDHRTYWEVRKPSKGLTGKTVFSIDSRHTTVTDAIAAASAQEQAAG